MIEPGGSAEEVARGAVMQGESSKMKIILRLGPKKLEEVLGMAVEGWENSGAG